MPPACGPHFELYQWRYAKREVKESTENVGMAQTMKDIIGHVEGFKLLFQGHSAETKCDEFCAFEDHTDSSEELKQIQKQFC